MIDNTPASFLKGKWKNISHSQPQEQFGTVKGNSRKKRRKPRVFYLAFDT